MRYFPLYLNIDNTQILLVGGGAVAHEKLEKLIDFTTNIKIVAKEISDETLAIINNLHLSYEQRAFKMSDLDAFDIIIVAVDDIPLQKEIYDRCKTLKKLCNSVDSVDYCDFIFPSYIKKGDLTIAISTSGKSPAVAKHLKEFIRSKLPVDIEEFLEHINNLRNSLPKGKNRMKFLSDLAKEYFKKSSDEKK